MIIKLQENIIKCEKILRDFEDDSIYKFYKMLGGKGRFENSIRNISINSINLRNKIIVDIEATIRATNNKDLIRIIENNYFNQITNAATQESLIRIVNLNSISIPPTAMNIITQDDKVINFINSISTNITSYNNEISNFRQLWNRFKLTLYSFPPIQVYPEILDGQINLINLIQAHNNSGNITAKNTVSISPAAAIKAKPSKQKAKNSNAKNITNKF
ncbi:hypothetical protein [Meridianimaribacter flavus]|uniref:Uncharacterized protein n=1 Tax=Meridianimaribacter flavus TaxID=571115 RepID=A0ABY2G6L8_9FLAO|nr:hypothetical protein [Meridianimaribacter flavus]TDY11949.1 hypothetical protein A8975_1791 [Meridianimaribacter flavus]